MKLLIGFLKNFMLPFVQSENKDIDRERLLDATAA